MNKAVVFVGLFAVIAIIAVILIVIGLLKGKSRMAIIGIVIAVCIALLFGPTVLIFFIQAVIVGIAIILLTKRKSNNIQSERVCPKCGKPVSEGKKFCTGCGAEIK